MQRRTFLRSTAFIGTTMLLGPELLLGQTKWVEEPESIQLKLDEVPGVAAQRRLGDSLASGTPGIAVDAAGHIRVTWVESTNNKEQIFLATFANGQWSAPAELVATEGPILHPTTLKWGTDSVVVWAEQRERQWRLYGCIITGEAERKAFPITEGTKAQWRPACVALDEDRLLVAYETATDGAIGVALQLVSRNGATKAIQFADPITKRRMHPAVAYNSQAGKVHLLWDEETGPGNRAIMHIELDANTLQVVGKPTKLSNTVGANQFPAIDIDATGRAWIAWQSNFSEATGWDLPKWFELRCLDNGQLLEPISQPRGKNLEKRTQDQGFECCRVRCLPSGEVMVTGRASHNFFIQQYSAKGWSSLYRLPVDGWGGRGQFLETALDADGNTWVVRRDINVQLVQKLVGEALGAPTANHLQPVTGEASNNAPMRIEVQDRWPALEPAANIQGPLLAWYGDLHGHTWTSDGCGEVDEYYFLRRECLRDDFAALTDHDTFVGKSILPGEWAYQKAMAELEGRDEGFITIFGQEWTTGRPPAGGGHKVFLSIDPEFVHYNHKQKPWGNVKGLTREMISKNAIAIPHHTGWTGSDWENANDEIMPLVEIVSIHGAFEYPDNRPIRPRGNFVGHFVQDALARGLHFGFIGGSDCHGLIWHHGAGWKRDSLRGGLAGVLAPELSREEIFSAFKKRRTFATSGTKPLVDFRINNHINGEIIDVDSSSVDIKLHLMSKLPVRWITIIRNNQPWREVGGTGMVEKLQWIDDAVPAGESWYYARIEFEGVEMAWSSPIWVRRA